MLEDILVPIAGMTTGLILLFPLVRAGVRVFERKHSGQGVESEELLNIRDDMRSLQDRLDQMEHADDRITELEERVDFAERLLAQHRDAPRVEGGR